MTTAEFKAWFEGYTEAMSGAPTKAQWARVKEKVAEINDVPIIQYVEKYTPRYDKFTPYWTCQDNTVLLSAADQLKDIGRNDFKAVMGI